MATATKWQATEDTCECGRQFKPQEPTICAEHKTPICAECGYCTEDPEHLKHARMEKLEAALRKIAAYIPTDTDYFKRCGEMQAIARAAIDWKP